MYRSFVVMVLLLALALSGAATSRGGGGPQHGAITITSNDQFTAPGSPTGCGCVTAGDGSPASPYVIGPWAISAPSGSPELTGWAVKVSGVSSSFAVTGISAGYQGVPASDPFIQLVDVNDATISNVSANGDGRGVEIDGSSNVTLDSLNLNKMTGNALFINGSSNVTLSNSKLKATADGVQAHNADGLYALNSQNLKIGGVAACPKSRTCNTFDYDTGWGIYLQNTDHVTIDQASANADDTGAFVLDNASYVDLGNATAEGDGPICITLGGTKTFTGYHTDLQGGVLLVNGSSNDTIHDLRIAAVGYGIGSGGNGFFSNPCTNSNDPFTAESPMGSGNTFTNVCYNSANPDLGQPPASLPLTDPCK